MKNKILIIAMLCAMGMGMSRCKCSNPMPRGILYESEVINNTNVSFVVEAYFPTPQTLHTKSNIVEPNKKELFFDFAVGASGEDSKVRYKFVTEVDNAVIADTTLTIKSKPYDGVDYQINMTLNADKTLIIKTIPIVQSETTKKVL